MSKERLLSFFLRMIGAFSIMAIFFVFVPYDWMNSIHQALDMGVLPPAPVVGYLARSTSAFYALLGGLMWLLSFDIKRNLHIVRYIGMVLTIFGILIFGVDWIEGMPLFWRIGEGPIVVFFGLFIFFLSGKIDHPRG